jgi:hypothetical protein
LRFSSAGAELYTWAVCGSSGMVMVGLAMVINQLVFYDKWPLNLNRSVGPPFRNAPELKRTPTPFRMKSAMAAKHLQNNSLGLRRSSSSRFLTTALALLASKLLTRLLAGLRKR